ncbi:MAG TPA: DICT sensory domain-containing protein [Pyrinomonadaceae bacterium]|nr:DICT sensory domain-containing protein [Pyrinomonadaceae bacterium]
MSEYAFVAAAESSAVEDLGDVSNVSRRDFDERETFVFRSQVPCLEYVSLLIENAVLLRTNRAGRIYAGFEKLSHLEAVIDRYLRIADISERVYVFGEPDWTPPRHPNMRLISVAENSTLSREWFVIADSPSVRVALVAHEEAEGFDIPQSEARWFRALKTSDPVLIAHFAAAAEDLVDASLAA